MLIGCPLNYSCTRFSPYRLHFSLHPRHASGVYLRKVALNLGFLKVITFQIDDHPDHLPVVHPSPFGASVALRGVRAVTLPYHPRPEGTPNRNPEPEPRRPSEAHPHSRTPIRISTPRPHTTGSCAITPCLCADHCCIIRYLAKFYAV